MLKNYKLIEVVPWIIGYIIFKVLNIAYVVLIPSIILSNMVSSTNVGQFLNKSLGFILIEIIITIGYTFLSVKTHAKFNWIRVRNIASVYKILLKLDYNQIFSRKILDKVDLEKY